MAYENLIRLVEVMNRLRSPGGCPWDAEQTHESLIKYQLEESYEFIEAVETGNRDDLKEELGDLLLQVYFHSRIAEEHIDAPFNIDDV
ncbi:MAG: MazG nucleotide pyrophosphohydrolase domain-containing protein, partial [Candidatus Nanopelagicaceae bacterium]